MTQTIVKACTSCGVASMGSRFCENCGAAAAPSMITSSTRLSEVIPAPIGAATSKPTAPASQLTSFDALRHLTLAAFISYSLIPVFLRWFSEITEPQSYLAPTILWWCTAVTMALALIAGIAGSAMIIVSDALKPSKIAGVIVVGFGLTLAITGSLPMGESFEYSSVTGPAIGFGVSLFVVWAMSSHFRGPGFIALAIAVVLDVCLQWSLTGRYSPIEGGSVLSGVLALGAVAIAVGGGAAFERARAKRPEPPPRQPAPLPIKPKPVAQSLHHAVDGARAPERLPAGYGPQPAFLYPPGSAPRTNGTAVAALVVTLLGMSGVGVILAHVARGQIHRTGEGGLGLTKAALVIGYLGLALSIGFTIYYVAVVATLFR